jgi:hypothetical protein
MLRCPSASVAAISFKIVDALTPAIALLAIDAFAAGGADAIFKGKVAVDTTTVAASAIGLPCAMFIVVATFPVARIADTSSAFGSSRAIGILGHASHWRWPILPRAAGCWRRPLANTVGSCRRHISLEVMQGVGCLGIVTALPVLLLLMLLLQLLLIDGLVDKFPHVCQAPAPLLAQLTHRLGIAVCSC